MNAPDSPAALHNVPVFADLDQEQLAMIVAHAEFTRIPAGQILMQQGEENDALHVVLEGELEIYLPADAETGREREVVLNRLASGGHSSEYSLIDRQPVSASVRAIQDSRLLRLRRVAFEELAAEHCAIGVAVYRNLLRGAVYRLRLKDRVLDIIGF